MRLEDGLCLVRLSEETERIYLKRKFIALACGQWTIAVLIFERVSSSPPRFDLALRPERVL